MRSIFTITTLFLICLVFTNSKLGKVQQCTGDAKTLTRNTPACKSTVCVKNGDKWKLTGTGCCNGAPCETYFCKNVGKTINVPASWIIGC